jgi:hypothetical protein
LRVILDEGVPRQVAKYLADHDVQTVASQGWAGIVNGRLLTLIEGAAFEAFGTADKNIPSQQSIEGRPFAVLLLSCNHWPTMEPHVAKITASVDAAKPGMVRLVECGEFRKRRRPYEP